LLYEGNPAVRCYFAGFLRAGSFAGFAGLMLELIERESINPLMALRGVVSRTGLELL